MNKKIRLLFVTDNMTERCGANVNILLTIVNRIKDEFICDILCQENRQRKIDCTKSKVFDTCMSFNFEQSETLIEFQKQHNWRKLSIIKKATLLFLHPTIFRDMIDIKYFGSKRSKNRYVEEIESAYKRKKYDAIVGICAPYYIAQAIAKAKVSTIKTIIQLDPYTYNYTMPSFLLFYRKRKEKEVIRKLSHIFAASFVYDEMIEKRMIDKRKVTSFMLPGILVDDEVIPSVKTSPNTHQGTINFVFVGQFYDKIRNPDFLLDLFCNLPLNFVLHIYGGGCESIIDRYLDKLGTRLVHHGWVSLDFAKQEMRNADFLININNTINNQMPSKLFEYIGIGKPIINICKIYCCPSLKYTCDIDNVINIFEKDDIKKSMEKVIEFTNRNYGKVISKDKIISNFKQCTDVYVSHYMMDKIKELIVEESSII